MTGCVSSAHGVVPHNRDGGRGRTFEALVPIVLIHKDIVCRASVSQHSTAQHSTAQAEIGHTHCAGSRAGPAWAAQR